MGKIKVAILEDNKLLLDDLMLELKKNDSVEVVFGMQESSDFIKNLASRKVDAVILDIELDGDNMNGVDVANIIKLPTLFISGKTKEHLDELEFLNLSLKLPIQFILKPATSLKLEKILPKFIQEVQFYQKTLQVETVKLRLNGCDETVNQDEIVFLESDTEDSSNKWIHIDGKGKFKLINFSFKDMFNRGFNPELFINPHKSFRINKNWVKGRKSWDLIVNYSYEKDKSKDYIIPISESNKPKIRRMFPSK